MHTKKRKKKQLYAHARACNFSYYTFINTIHKEWRKTLLLVRYTLNDVETYDMG